MTDFDRLLLDARLGSEQSKEKLFAYCTHYLGHLANHRVRGRLRRKIDPEDLSQDVMADVFRQFDQFKGNCEKEFTAWLRRIFEGHTAMLYRRYFTQQRNLNLEQPLELEETIAIALARYINKGKSPSAHAMHREEAGILADALEGLPAAYKEVILLRQFESKSFLEIANLMGRSEDSVQKLWVRGVIKLRMSLKVPLGLG